MNGQRHPKVEASHLAREAYLYVRQATCCQGIANTESLQRQYRLQQHALALGWPAERVIVIDDDLGRSGASTKDRRGFQDLMRQVRGGRVGVLMALDASRLTRNAADWHRLLEACALSDTLLLDQHGLYDPTDSHERVLLGGDETMLRTVPFSRDEQQKEALV
jgi:DNA invertase Pin-like site-specific DNA recombinase